MEPFLRWLGFGFYKNWEKNLWTYFEHTRFKNLIVFGCPPRFRAILYNFSNICSTQLSKIVENYPQWNKKTNSFYRRPITINIPTYYIVMHWCAYSFLKRQVWDAYKYVQLLHPTLHNGSFWRKKCEWKIYCAWLLGFEKLPAFIVLKNNLKDFKTSR